ncbi:sigma factor, partial [Streptomyces daliensis]
MLDATGHPPGDQDENRARFELLYVIYFRRLHAYIAARLGRRFGLADDISQDTWLEVWRSLPTLRASDDRA